MVTVSLTGASKEDAATVFDVLRTAFPTDRPSDAVAQQQPGTTLPCGPRSSNRRRTAYRPGRPHHWRVRPPPRCRAAMSPWTSSAKP